MTVMGGCRAVATNKNLFILILMVACFEGSMFTFVFNWTPALKNDYTMPAFGMIFATLLMAYMCGSCCVQLRNATNPIKDGQASNALGPICFLVAGIAHSKGINKAALTIVYLGFIGFVFCCGLHMPSDASVKGEFVPEHVRSMVYNIYRVPMNAIVLIVLLTHIKRLRGSEGPVKWAWRAPGLVSVV